MPRGLNRTDLNTTGISYKNGFPIDTDTHVWGNPVDWEISPSYFGTIVSLPVSFGNAITWKPISNHFGNSV
jgi:hypothetical protein